MRFAVLDIETTALDASFGRLVCASFKFTDEKKARTVRCQYFKDEPKALQEITDLYNKADIVMTWNGKLFDIKMLNARLFFHGMQPLDSKMHIDLMWTCRTNLRFRGSRLDAISKDLKTKTRKHDVPAWRWVMAAEGHKESLEEIVKHCELDVLLTEEVFKRFKPFIKRITR